MDKWSESAPTRRFAVLLALVSVLVRDPAPVRPRTRSDALLFTGDPAGAGAPRRTTRPGAFFPTLASTLALTIAAAALGPHPFATARAGSLNAGAVAQEPAPPSPERPVDGPVAEWFDAPAGRFDPGHRGIDLAVPLGTPVHAAADGTVAFAGVIAGSRFVTLVHPALPGTGRLETTYSFLSRIDVHAGDTVHAGDILGASGTGHPGGTVASLHFGVRRDGRYVDPAPMLGLSQAVPGDVSGLVSLGPLPRRKPLAPRPTPPAPRPPTRLLAQGRSRETTSARAAPGLGRGPRPASGPVRQQCADEATAPLPALPTSAELHAGARAPAPPGENVVVAIAGIGSSTWPLPDGSVASDAAMYRLDLRTLGYPADRIHHFSYRGVPANEQPSQAGDSAPYRLHLPYNRRDTFQPIARSAVLLQQLVERIHAADPTRHIDLVAHSQGGVVAQYYVEQLYDPARPGGPVVDHLVTIASPHLGADLAGLSARLGAVGAAEPVRRRMDRLAEALGAPPPGSPAAGDLAPGSPTMDDLTRRWAESAEAASVRTTTIAAGSDLVVPAQRTKLPGTLNYTVDVPGTGASLWTAHTAIVAAEATKRIAYGALSDRPAPCTTLEDLIAGSIAGPLISALQASLLDTLAGAAAPAGQ